MTWRDEHNQVPPLTIERARQLVRLILRYDEDSEARALIELITGIGYDRETWRRDGLALVAMQEAYSLTSEFSRAAERYATRAALRASEGTSEDG